MAIKDNLGNGVVIFEDGRVSTPESRRAVIAKNTGALTKQQAALLDVAKTNPAWAIQQAFRLGAASVGSDETQAAIKRLIDIMENDAEEIKAAYDDSMPSEAKQDYDERKKLAKVLRGMLGKED